MTNVRNTPTNKPPGELPKTAADAGHVAVYDNDSTDGRPANVLDAPESDPRTSTAYTHEPVATSGFNVVPWVIGLAVLAVLIYIIFQVLF